MKSFVFKSAVTVPAVKATLLFSIKLLPVPDNVTLPLPKLTDAFVTAVNDVLLPRLIPVPVIDPETLNLLLSPRDILPNSRLFALPVLKVTFSPNKFTLPKLPVAPFPTVKVFAGPDVFDKFQPLRS